MLGAVIGLDIDAVDRIAAQPRLQALDALRAQREPFVLCQTVDRDADGVVRATPNVVRPGEKLHVVVDRPANRPRGSYSAILRSRGHDHSVTAWLEVKADGSAAGDVVLPAGAPPGEWDLSVTQPESTREASAAETFHHDLIQKIRHLGARARRRASPAASPSPAPVVERVREIAPHQPAAAPVAHLPLARRPFSMLAPRVLLIGSSTGGPQALMTLVTDIGPTRALTVTYLVPLFGMLWGATVLGEPLTAPMLGGAVLVLAGTVLVLRR